MKYQDPAERVLLPVIISVTVETAQLLSEMANEMDVSLDEVVTAISEEAVTGLSRKDFIEDVYIPDRCSREDLLRVLE